MDAYARVFPFSEIVPISALTGDGLTVLLDCIVKVLPEGPKYFPEDMITDEPERFIAAEIVREKVFKLTKEEVPYSVAVVTERFEEKKTLIHINAAVVVERESQKAIIIGKGGAMLKKIGTEARADIEKLLSERVFLELFVKVEKDWTKKERLLKEFGKGYGS
jgi:GTP-binding protein Era